LSYDGPPSNLRATNPFPADDAEYDELWVSLSWDAAPAAAEHDVYFGTNFDDVNDANNLDPMGEGEIYKARQTDDFYDVCDLVPGTTYYWRIDEVNDPNLWKGNVWSFWLCTWEPTNPSPPDGATWVSPYTDLSWSAGFQAGKHEVFFGTDPCSLPQIAKFTGDPTCDPGTLLKDTTYYWQVLEYAEEKTLGPIWSFTTLPVIPITDPNLVGWWTFDEGEGTYAIDWSGHGNDGTLIGDPQWVTGQVGGALKFNGAEYVEVPAAAWSSVEKQVTIAFWAYGDP
ncbi:unnamed protein product, partial [marine sediment metagenome]